MNSRDKTEKEPEQHTIPYTIKIMPVEHVTIMPERIDVMGLLYNYSTQSQSTNSLIQQYLPKKLQKEITEDQIDGIYDNLKLLSAEKKKNKNAAEVLLDNPIMPFDKSSINKVNLKPQETKAKDKKDLLE